MKNGRPQGCYLAALLFLLLTASLFAQTPTITTVQMDGFEFTLSNNHPLIIKKDGKPLALVNNRTLHFIASANVDAAGQKNLQDELDKFFINHPASYADSATVSSGTTASPSATGDTVKWISGDPTVRLADGWVIEFSGGNGSKIHATDPHGYFVSMHFKPGAHGVGSAVKGAATSIATLGTDASFEGGAWEGESQGGKNFTQDQGLMGVKTHTPILVVQAASEVLKAQQVVLASSAHQYSFVGTSNMDRLSKRQ
jgi:hypothetical protein